MPDDAKAVPSAAPSAWTPAPGDAFPDAALALHLLAQARAHRDRGGAGPVAAVLRSLPRLQRIAALARAMAPDVQVLSLPPWDVLPYDRTQPSAAVAAQPPLRVAACAAVRKAA